MKQKWLVTASDISKSSDGSAPANFRDDAVAFGLNITSTGETGSGSIWIEYNVEFASPRQPEPIVNASVASAGTTNKVLNLAQHAGTTCPVEPGQTFFVAGTSGTVNLNSGYTAVGSGNTDGINWTQVLRTPQATSDVWGSLTGNSNTLYATLASVALKPLITRLKNLVIQ